MDGIRRRRLWLAIVAVVVCAGTIALFIAGPFRHAEIGPQGKSGPTAQGDTSLAAEYSFPEPAQATIEDLVQEATQVAAGLVERFPDRPESFDVMARVHSRFGDSAEAVKYWEKCVELNPRFLTAYNALAMVALEKQEYEKAASLARKALEIDPASTEASIHLAKALMNLGKMEEVVELLETAAEKNSRSMPTFLLLGQAYLQLQEYEKAKKSFETAAEIAPTYPNIYYGLARACAKLGQKEDAKKHTETFRKLGATDLEQRIDREKTFDDLVSVRRSVAQTHTDAGRIHARQGNVRPAESLWKRAAALDPANTGCRLELLSLYERSDKEREALDVCEQLRKIDPENADYCLNASLLNARLNRFDAALAAVGRAIELDPDNPRYRQVYELIKKGK